MNNYCFFRLLVTAVLRLAATLISCLSPTRGLPTDASTPQQHSSGMLIFLLQAISGLGVEHVS